MRMTLTPCALTRRISERCPSWSFVLVDLRAHGQSLDPPPPFTVEAAAEDLVRLEGASARTVSRR